MSTSNANTNDSKRLILIRHGRTHMNEYLATEGSNWGDTKFTDMFDESVHHLYKDSPLSQKGTRQAQELHKYFLSTEKGREIIQDIELVAVSPLRRTLQTAEIGILPHFCSSSSSESDDSLSSTSSPSPSPSVPFVALPLASERVYLISDIGKSTTQLNQLFSFADFDREFDKFDGEEWWFTVKDSTSGNGSRESSSSTKECDAPSDIHSFNYMYRDNYEEWRPNDGDQEYACLGEPDDAFHKRMRSLYQWIESREETVICLVCHFGVLEWLVGEKFDNCEVQDVSFEKIKAHVLDSSRMLPEN